MWWLGPRHVDLRNLAAEIKSPAEAAVFAVHRGFAVSQLLEERSKVRSGLLRCRKGDASQRQVGDMTDLS